MSLARRDFLALPLLLGAARDVGADDSLVDLWSDFRTFSGRWSGKQTGVWGDGVGIRTFRFFIDGGFLEQRTAMRFDPQPANPEGDMRLDYGVMNFDRRGRKFYFRRYYPGELFIEFSLKEMDPVAGRFVWLSERVENGMPDTAVEYTVVRESGDKFSEKTVLLRQNEEPRVAVEAHWERAH